MYRMAWRSCKSGKKAAQALHHLWHSSGGQDLADERVRQQGVYGSANYINFDNNERMKILFEGRLEVEQFITGLELHAGHKIDPDNALLILTRYRRCPGR